MPVTAVLTVVPAMLTVITAVLTVVTVVLTVVTAVLTVVPAVLNIVRQHSWQTAFKIPAAFKIQISFTTLTRNQSIERWLASLASGFRWLPSNALTRTDS